MTAANVVFACAQIALLVAVCAPLPRLLGLRSPVVQYVFWRVLLAACVLLPVLEPIEMVFVPAPAATVAAAALLPHPGTNSPSASAPVLDWVTFATGVIGAGIVLRLAWIAIGILRLRRMKRRAVETAIGFRDLEHAVGVTAPILWSREVTHPVTFGVVRPVVLLPISVKSVDAAAQRAVVAHELHHVKRHDWLWIVAEEMARSLVWFHPAVWWLISRIQLARETVVDELSILTTNARRAYLDTLLAFADDTGWESLPAFSARRHLFHRVMLLSKEGNMSSIRIAVASGVLALAIGAGSWGVVQAFPLYGPSQQRNQPPPPPPPRDPLSPAAYHRLAAQYLDNVNRDMSLTEDQKLDAILKGIAAEDRALELKPDYADAMMYKAVLLRMQASLTSDLAERDRLLAQATELRRKTMALRPSPPPPPPPPPGGVTAGVPGEWNLLYMPESFELRMKELNPVRIGGGVKQPTKTRDVKPAYPPIAQQAGVQGAVIVETVIDADGNVAEARILRSIPLLDQAALDAVRQWKFAPPLLNGAPTAIMMTVAVNFTLP